MPDPNRCPQCGGLVGMFAAGCAICGAELDPFRGRRRGLVDGLRSAWVSRPRFRARITAKKNRP